MKLPRIESHLPAVSFELEGKYWIACGANWIETDRIYSPKELNKIWVKTKPKYMVVVEKPKKPVAYVVKGSKGNIYKIVNAEGVWTCSCPAHGFGRGKDCKHIIQIKNKK